MTDKGCLKTEVHFFFYLTKYEDVTHHFHFSFLFPACSRFYWRQSNGPVLQLTHCVFVCVWEGKVSYNSSVIIFPQLLH